jgi:hypothetical protein
MPMFPFTAVVGGGATYLPLSTWQFRQPARKAILEIFVNATAVGCVQNLTSGAESIVQAESPVSAGAAAGVIPARLTTEPAVDMVDPGDELVLTVRNTTGGNITVNGLAVLTYQGS